MKFLNDALKGLSLIGSIPNKAYASIRFKKAVNKFLRKHTNGSYAVTTLSNFDYEDGEFICYTLQKANLEKSAAMEENVFYIFLPFSTTHTRVVAKTTGNGGVELLSFYGKSLHENIAVFMLKSFGETKSVSGTS